MIDLQAESVVSLNEATRILPAIDGKRPHLSALHRWCMYGVSGVRLEHARIGGRVVTSREALNRFAHALAEAKAARFNAPAPPPAPAARRTSPALRRKQIEQARRTLAEHGIDWSPESAAEGGAR